ncbi:cytidine deaminase-like protein [Russula ochroleuca]|uniref:Cytidine deaminase-like protein n=1 Tax=Russula ochroleuca TaxID=152965 RepID=A0A9P5JW21_9AGAM|nr:cytidine deaminase-like protein [Russula ochroleuca]
MGYARSTVANCMPDLNDPTSSTSYRPAPTAPEHLNNTGCKIKYSEGKGRGVYASKPMPAYTLLEINPALLFSAEEYEAHGRHTVLDHYTFKWRDGRMALALGLGSLFNHSDSPNVSYSIDTSTESIRYTTVRAVEPDEELCIYYGTNLWFKPVEISDGRTCADTELVDDGWGGLSAVAGEVEASSSSNHVPEDTSDPNAIVPDEDLPFTRVKLTSDEDDEETSEAVRTVQAWAVDIPDPRHTTSALKWLKSSGLDTPTLSHLKRVRKSPTGTHSTLLLTSTSPTIAPELPSDLDLAAPYQLAVPRSAALTPTSLALKNALWPTVFAPRRKGEPEDWSRARAQWACAAMVRVVEEARAARAAGELPIASYVPAPPEEPAWPSYLARDTRVSSAHPLRHAALNVVRALSNSTASTSASIIPATAAASTPPTSAPTKNGQHYLLTSRALFVTHEPCVMCSMALLHSRVKEVFFLVPMQRTGGCGGAACVPKLEGVNHRFAIGRWKTGAGGVSVEGLEIDEDIDS